MQVEIKQVRYSVALSGLSFVDAPVPGVLRFAQAQAENTPVCVLSHLRCFSPDTNIKNLRSLRSKRRLFVGCGAAARRRGLRSVEHRLTLHGGKAHAPRSIGLRSTERKTHPLVPSLKMAFRTSFLPVTPERLSYFTFFYFFLVKSC